MSAPTKKGCLERLKVSNEEQVVEYDGEGEPVVYARRWFILIAVAFSYMAWLQHTLKHVPLAAEYARYFDTTSDFEPGEGELGIDFFPIFEGVLVLFFYPIAGKLLDNFGLKIMVIGTVLQALSAWWFYLAFTNYNAALASKALASAAGPLISTSLLKVSMQWFPPRERPLAVGIAVLLSESGAGVALLQADFFLNSAEDELDLEFKSCFDDFIDKANKNNITECNDEARESQCCLFNANIDALNLTMALLTTIVAVYSIFVVRERPKTAPSVAGLEKTSPSLFKALALMFGNRNYAQICIADFIMSGPPQVLFLALSRIVPASVDGFEVYGAAGAILLSFPAAAYFSFSLNRTKKFFEYTAIAYTSGFLLWLAATICILIDTKLFDILFVVVGSIALVAFVLWTSAVYELKEEYVFQKSSYLEGFIVGIDRAIINLSLVVFLSAIPPERADNLDVSGAQFTLLVGLVFMFIGTLIVWTTPHKRRYRRTHFELENAGKASLIDIHENRDNDFDHLQDDTKKENLETETT